MMRPLIAPRALWALLGTVLLSAVVWIFSPLIGEIFATRWLRATLVTLFLLTWALVVLLLARRRAARDTGLVEAATAAGAARDAAVAEEEGELRDRLTDALRRLRSATSGRGIQLYDLPWYVIIGPPGSGKTTALLNSGLEFPLAEGRVGGVGGTRFCDWWLSEQAVLLDTAGRYTTQDSEPEVDRAGWESFLDLLRRHRPRMPLNGILVAFGVDMIASLDAEAREAHARSIRRRIKELQHRLGQRLPVYMLVTKTDLLPGFIEFFDDLDREARQQVWGFTFPLTDAPEGGLPGFSTEFRALLSRLNARTLERLQAERGPQQRALIAGFPPQVASMEAPLEAFMRVAFGGSRLEPAPLLRGVYFTSGTQAGSPLDRLAGALARGFSVDAARPAAVVGQKGRAFFLGRTLRELVFGEARLAAKDGHIVKRQRILRFAALGAAGIALAAGIAWGWNAIHTEAAREQRLAVALERAAEAGRAAPLAGAPTPAIVAALPYLDTVRALHAAAQGEGPGFAISQEANLTSSADAAYRRTLGSVLLPRLIARLEGQIRDGLQRPEFLYEALRVYLMLGREGPLDRALLREWFALDAQAMFPGSLNQQQRDAFLAHVDALLSSQLTPYTLDATLVDEARRILSRLPMAARVYARLRLSTEGLRSFNPAEALGAAGQRYFTRPSGRPLTEGVGGLFTVEGLRGHILRHLPRALVEAGEESWVLGPNAATVGDPRRLEADILALYAADYVRAWEALLSDLVITPLPNIAAAADALNLLSAPSSPIKDLLRAVARQLSPGDAPAPAGAAGAAGQAAGQALTGQEAGRIAAVLGAQASGPSGAALVAQVVEARFQPLRDAAGPALDQVLTLMNDLYVEVARVAAAPPGAPIPPAPGLDPGQRLLAEAQRQPEPLQGWLMTLGQSSQRLRTNGTQAAVAAAGAQQLAPFCRGIEQRFPFRRVANAPDIPFDDFTRLFGPNGMMESFFTQNLRSFTDTTANPWRPVTRAGPAPVSAQDLLQFQRAQAIRDAFFLPGSTSVRFQLIPQRLIGNASQAVLEIGGQQHVLPANGGRPIDVVFPAQHPVTLTFTPTAPAGPLVYQGPWSVLRFVFLGRLMPTAQPDQFRLVVMQGQSGAEFVLQASSQVNPFGLRELTEFHCPALPSN